MYQLPQQAIYGINDNFKALSCQNGISLILHKKRNMRTGKPKKVSILVFEGCTPMSPIGAMEILNKAGGLHQQLSKTNKPFFDTQLVGVHTKKVKASDKFFLNCHTTLDQIDQTDIMLIPSMEFDVEHKLNQNKKAIAHLLRLKRKGTELGSMCTGAFLLAATGLLKNKSATTHWFVASKFKAMFPDIRLENDKIIVDENGIYSSGGATSSLHLCLYLTEKYCGRQTANMAARMLQLDRDQSTQTRFSMFIPQTQHNDEAVFEAQQAIELDQDEKLTVEDLSKIVHVSKRSFIRRFKAATGNTPIEYIQRMNVEKAKRQLENSRSSIEQIIYSLGYNDIPSFRKIFMRYTDLTPKEYRGKYGM
jgi:transcriptional regulator GlxA family with amidase domain